LSIAQYHYGKGAIWLFCRFEIIPDGMANNEHFGFSIFPDAIIPFGLAFDQL
jgi:hypothetical protein